MDRAEATGVGVAVVGHAALIAALAAGFAVTQAPPPQEALEVSFVEEVGPVSSAPVIAQEPAPSVGEEAGPPAEASGATASVPAPIVPPVPEPIRPPVETGERRRPDLTRNPVIIRPAPAPRIAQAQPQPRPQPQQRVQPQRPQPQPQRQQVQPQRPSAQPGRGQAPRSSGFDPGRLAQTLGSGPPQSRGTSEGAPARLTGAQQQQISRQIGGLIQPCAARARPPNDLARSISVDLRVTVTESGAPTGHQLVGSSGTNANNDDYVDDVVGVAIRAVQACASRIATLPAEYYQNGWRTFRYRFRFP
jgi:outer membrane biosynthesis protein TonB